MADGTLGREAAQIRKKIGEKEILGQIASLLVKESLIKPEEQLRFLTLLREEESK